MEWDLRDGNWSRHGPVAVRGQGFEGTTPLSDAAVAARFADADSLSAVAAVAADLAGFYAAVVDAGARTYLVADGARSIPLYYDRDARVVSDCGRAVARAVDADRDPVTASEFLLTRYVAGPDTIWQGVHATQAGEVVAVGDETTRRTYRDHWPGKAAGDAVDDPAAVLGRAFETVLDRLLAVAGDRRVVVPLSGGYDSRLLVAGLVERDHPVTGFAFGKPGHPDVEVSREVADRLGIDWALVAYDQADWRAWYRGPGRRLREQFAGDALPFGAAHPAVRRLVETGRVPADALWCPGHAVTTPGERVPLFAGEQAGSSGGDSDSARANQRVEPDVDALVEHILAEQYALWEWEDPAFARAARERIQRGLLGERSPSAIADPSSAGAAFERWAWRGRQTTFTTGDLRGYDDAGLDWWLPLWDPAYVRAYRCLPLSARRERRAHTQLAQERYRRAAGTAPESMIPDDRVAVTDRTLDPLDRVCARVRHTPARTVIHDGIEGGLRERIAWEPSFLRPRSSWNAPGSHPLAWYGMLAPALQERLPDRSLYAIRTLALLRDIDLGDPGASLPDTPTVDLPTDTLDDR